MQSLAARLSAPLYSVFPQVMCEAYNGGPLAPRAAVGRCPRGIAVAASPPRRPYIAAAATHTPPRPLGVSWPRGVAGSRAAAVLLIVFFSPLVLSFCPPAVAGGRGLFICALLAAHSAATSARLKN